MIRIKKIELVSTLVVTFFLLTACSSASTQKIKLTYSAAASLQQPLTRIVKNYEKTHANLTINLDFAGSGTIREQVTAGAPIDGIFLASKSDISKLGDKVTDSRVLLSNSLVLIAPSTSSQTSISANNAVSADQFKKIMLSADRLAIGQPSTVPAGMYAQETLKTLGVLEQVQSKFVQGSDVTQVLSYVSSGNAALGFVYKTDALTTDKVKIIYAVPAKTHEPIVYEGATVSSSSHPSQVEAFNNYLNSAAAQEIFEKAGFTVP